MSAVFYCYIVCFTSNKYFVVLVLVSTMVAEKVVGCWVRCGPQSVGRFYGSPSTVLVDCRLHSNSTVSSYCTIVLVQVPGTVQYFYKYKYCTYNFFHE